MSDEHPIFDEEHGEPPAAATPHRRRRHGCLPVLVVGLVLAVLAVGALHFGRARIKEIFAPAPDYAGPGSGAVVFQVPEGASTITIGRELKAKHVVKSVDAFTAAARHNSKALNIQVGYYQLKEHMKASEALAVLVDPTNLIQNVVTIPEGARVRDIVKTIVAKTRISRRDLVAALSHPARIGLPTMAHGNPEGYLFPATYTVAPGETAVELLKQMVQKTSDVYGSLGLEQAARARGLTPEQLVTVASILEYEASRDQDYPKVARAIYNRLQKGMPLQSDATVSYAAGVSGQIWTSAAQRANSSPYNTYQHTGLPPGPIGSPGETTLKAAMHPADGPWLYWVVVNLRTGETVFSTTLEGHNKAVARFREYCKTSTAC